MESTESSLLSVISEHSGAAECRVHGRSQFWLEWLRQNRFLLSIIFHLPQLLNLEFVIRFSQPYFYFLFLFFNSFFLVGCVLGSLFFSLKFYQNLVAKILLPTLIITNVFFIEINKY
jgi:hypothetical protein